MYDVITIGSSTIDVFAKTEKSDLISIQTQKPSDNESFLAYPVGTKILVNELEVTTGGGGTNTAVALAKLGLRVGYCGTIGDDKNGIMILDTLKSEKIDFLGSFSKNMSGYSIILDSIANDRTILAYKGSNNDFRFANINKSKLKTKWFYMCAMVEHSYEELEKASVFAKQKGIKVVFNPSSYLAEKGFEYLEKMLTNTDILVLNKEEAKDIVGNHEPDMLLKELKNKAGCEIVIITDGKEGVYVINEKFIYRGYPHQIKVVETTGAGDAFGSSFLAGIIKKNDVEFAIKLAITNSESVITHHGAKTNLLKWSRAQYLMKKSPVIVKKKRI